MWRPPRERASARAALGAAGGSAAGGAVPAHVSARKKREGLCAFVRRPARRVWARRGRTLVVWRACTRLLPHSAAVPEGLGVYTASVPALQRDVAAAYRWVPRSAFLLALPVVLRVSLSSVTVFAQSAFPIST